MNSPPTVILTQTHPDAAATASGASPPAPAPVPEKTPAPGTATTTDARGRVLVIRKLSPLQRMRIFKALGADGAKNPMLLGYAILACAVVSIDGVAEPFPQTERQIEAIISRLEDEGFEAVAIKYRETWGDDEEDEAEPDAIKNS